MKLVHNIKISAFCKENEDGQVIREGLLFLIGMDAAGLEKQKLKIDAKIVQGFSEKKITVFSIQIDKQRHTKAFLDHLHTLLAQGQKKIIVTEAKSRLDEEFFFFLRFEKNAIINNQKLMLTDGGNCYHVKMSIAAFPKSREKALDIIQSIFSEHLNNEGTA